MKACHALLSVLLLVNSPFCLAEMGLKTGGAITRHGAPSFRYQWEPSLPAEPEYHAYDIAIRLQQAIEELINNGRLSAASMRRVLLAILYGRSVVTSPPPLIFVKLPPNAIYQLGAGSSKSKPTKQKAQASGSRKSDVALSRSSPTIGGMVFALLSRRVDDVLVQHETFTSIVAMTLVTQDEPVGGGSTSQVYKIGLNGKTYAVKKAQSTMNTEGLVKEGANLFEIDHPNIIRLEALAYSDTTALLIFEYYPMDLWELFFESDGSQLPSPSEGIDYLSQLVSALVYLHEKGFSHSDLKPENIYISARGSLVLGDLGNLGRTGQPRPTANSGIYAAPEVQEGGRPNQLSDLWELGIIIAFFLKPEEIWRMLKANAGHMNAWEFIRQFARDEGVDHEWDSILQISRDQVSRGFIPDGSEAWQLLSNKAFLYALAIMCLRLKAEDRLNSTLLRTLLTKYLAHNTSNSSEELDTRR